MRKIINDPLADQDIELLSPLSQSDNLYLIKSRGVTRLSRDFTALSYIKTLLQELESESTTNINLNMLNLKREPLIEELKAKIETLLKNNLKIAHIDIEEFKDPESGETQIIVTVPLDPNIEDPFEELDKLHAEIGRFDKALATKIILLPAEPTE